MAEAVIPRDYAGPIIRKRERLSDVTAQTSISGPVEAKGGCFATRPAYEPPELNKREKLTDVTSLNTTSGQLVG